MNENPSYIDPILKLGNYYYFCEEGQKILDKPSNKNKYIIIIDIEKFKLFNKRYGHITGKKMLIEVGRVLNKKLKGALIAGLSSDAFGVIVETEDIIRVIEKIERSLSNVIVEDNQYKITPIIGIYCCQKEDGILQAIDKAIIAHDGVGGNYNKKYKIFDEKDEQRLLEEAEIEENMEKALKNKEFKIYYQPKINLKDRSKIMAEVLVRWDRENEQISPSKFIPIFEKNKFILKLDKYVYEQVCKDLKNWKNRYNLDIWISINISKEHFDTQNFVEEYVNIAKKYGIATKNIELEITETAAVDADLCEITKDIRNKGFRIALDDFGTGYSTLNMLQDIQIDVLKIDKTFIDKINNDNEQIDLVKYIIKMSKELGIETVAEGVENEKQVQYLKENGCDIIQGYYYSKPLTKQTFEKWLRQWN